MYEIEDIVNFSFAVSGCMLAFLGLVLSSTIHFIDNFVKKYFLTFFWILLLYIFSDMVSLLSLDFGEGT
ncbi:MAG: hypothetical protein IJ736_01795, partial [Firmicutes bacterium]|nr:hypothetical protein [Bacillota bacterium]